MLLIKYDHNLVESHQSHLLIPPTFPTLKHQSAPQQNFCALYTACTKVKHNHDLPSKYIILMNEVQLYNNIIVSDHW